MRWDVDCATCKARPGEPCRSLVGKHAGAAHAARREASSQRTRALHAVGVGDLSVARARRDLRELNAKRAGAQ